VQRAELQARAEALAAEPALDARNATYELFWDLVIESADNIAYRLALNTLLAGQRVLAFEAPLLAAELRDGDAVRSLARTVAAGDADLAHALARELLDRTIPGG
jgi:GntR family transcriptional regulator, transcriptional repressor for pyruvate dehydrogenase complex